MSFILQCTGTIKACFIKHGLTFFYLTVYRNDKCITIIHTFDANLCFCLSPPEKNTQVYVVCVCVCVRVCVCVCVWVCMRVCIFIAVGEHVCVYMCGCGSPYVCRLIKCILCISRSITIHTGGVLVQFVCSPHNGGRSHLSSLYELHVGICQINMNNAHTNILLQLPGCRQSTGPN